MFILRLSREVPIVHAVAHMLERSGIDRFACNSPCVLPDTMAADKLKCGNYNWCGPELLLMQFVYTSQILILSNKKKSEKCKFLLNLSHGKTFNFVGIVTESSINDFVTSNCMETFNQASLIVVEFYDILKTTAELLFRLIYSLFLEGF